MLYEDLSKIALNSPTEQIAYLLVDQSTCFGKLELGDSKSQCQKHMSTKLQKEFPQVSKTK